RGDPEYLLPCLRPGEGLFRLGEGRGVRVTRGGLEEDVGECLALDLLLDLDPVLQHTHPTPPVSVFAYEAASHMPNGIRTSAGHDNSENQLGGDMRYRLTQYAHGGGCACKIPPGELEAIVAGLVDTDKPDDLVIGLDDGDDAAVVRIEDGQAVVATAD